MILQPLVNEFYGMKYVLNMSTMKNIIRLQVALIPFPPLNVGKKAVTQSTQRVLQSMHTQEGSMRIVSQKGVITCNLAKLEHHFILKHGE